MSNLWTGRKLAAPFVVAIERPTQPLIKRLDIATFGKRTPVPVELPRALGQRVYQLFQMLFTTTQQVEYDCLTALDFLLDATSHPGRQPGSPKPTYGYSERADPCPADPNAMKPGSAYLIKDQGSKNMAVHGMLAVTKTHALHIAGPQGGLARTRAADILTIWPGTLHQILARHSS